MEQFTALEDLGVLSDEQMEQVAEMAKTSAIEVNTVVRKARPKIRQEFVVAFIDNLQVLADLGLSSRQIKVMLYILKAMEFGNLVMLSAKQMGADLGIDKSNVSRDLKALKTKGVIVENNGHTYVNANLFAKGLKGGMGPERTQHLHAAKSDHSGKYKETF